MLPKTLKTKFLLYSCQIGLYLLCAHGEILRSTSEDSLLKSENLFKKYIYLYLLLKDQLWPSCALSMWRCKEPG